MACTSHLPPLPALHSDRHDSFPGVHLDVRFRPKIPKIPNPLRSDVASSRLRRTRGSALPIDGPENEHVEIEGFDLAVSLFNGGDYYRCHDVLEEIWYDADEPARTLLHGILQCAVGLHHLFDKNHRGAMMELGEGLCKLRKIGFEDGPFRVFEEEISVALEFLYRTQKELAACTEDLCLTMDGSERSYQLLGTFAAGQELYAMESDNGVSYIKFCSNDQHNINEALRVKLPILNATKESLKTCESL